MTNFPLADYDEAKNLVKKSFPRWILSQEVRNDTYFGDY